MYLVLSIEGNRDSINYPPLILSKIYIKNNRMKEENNGALQMITVTQEIQIFSKD